MNKSNINESIIDVLYVVNLDELAPQLAQDFASDGVKGVRNEDNCIVFEMPDGGEMWAEFDFGKFGTIEHMEITKGMNGAHIWSRDFFKHDTWSYDDFKEIFSYAMKDYAKVVDDDDDMYESVVHKVTESVMRKLNEWGGEQFSLEMTIVDAVDDDIDRERRADSGEHVVEIDYEVDNEDTVRGEVSFSLDYEKKTPILSDFDVELWIDYGDFRSASEDYNNYSLDDIVAKLKDRGIIVKD